MQKKIIVVDDEEDILNLVNTILTSSGYDVRTDTSGAIINKIGEIHPDLILLDINLKNEDGREICKKLKSQKSTSHVPVVLFSSMVELQKISQENGADDYLSKPFEIKDLLTTVERSIEAA